MITEDKKSKIVEEIVDAIFPDNFGGYGNFKDYMVQGVLLPEFKRTMLGISEKIFGDPNRSSHQDYTSYSRGNNANNGYLSSTDLTCEVVFGSANDASGVIKSVKDDIKAYGFERISDFYEIVDRAHGTILKGPKASWALQNYGWHSFNDADVKYMRDGRWQIRLSYPESIR